MEIEETPFIRIQRFNQLGSIAAANRQNTGIRFSIRQLQDLIVELQQLSNEEGRDDDFFDSFPNATGVVFMIGKEHGYNQYTLEVMPVVGEDLPSVTHGIEPKWDFIIHANNYAFSPYDGGGGGVSQKTPPPFPNTTPAAN